MRALCSLVSGADFIRFRVVPHARRRQPRFGRLTLNIVSSQLLFPPTASESSAGLRKAEPVSRRVVLVAHAEIPCASLRATPGILCLEKGCSERPSADLDTQQPLYLIPE